MAEEEHASLELDKLEASGMPAEDAAGTELHEDGESEGTVAKPEGVGRHIFGVFKDRGFILSFIIGGVLAGATLFFLFFYKGTPETDRLDQFRGRITHRISAPIGFKYHVTFRLIIPFKDGDEKRILTEKLSAIRPRLMQLSQDPDIIKNVREKDMETLQTRILSIASDAVNIPVEELDLTDLALD